MMIDKAVTEENKKIAVEFLHLISVANLDEICSMITPTWKMWGGPPDLPAGPEGMHKLFSTFGKIEQQWVIDDVMAENDKVVVRATNHCIQDSFFGVPGEGIRQTFTAMFIHRFADGKIAETWRNANDLGRIFQLGGKVVKN